MGRPTGAATTADKLIERLTEELSLDCTCRSITCLTCLQHEVARLWARLRDIEQQRLRSFAIRRPYCSPERTVIVAYSAEEAIDLAHKAYGYASNTTAQDSEVDRG